MKPLVSAAHRFALAGLLLLGLALVGVTVIVFDTVAGHTAAVIAGICAVLGFIGLWLALPCGLPISQLGNPAAMLIRRIARPLLSAVFIGQGVDSLRNPKPAADAARPTVEGLQALPDPVSSKMPRDAEMFARINAAIQVGGGVLLASGKMPRIASAALACTVIPGTLVAHMFWSEVDPESKARKRREFLTDLSLLGDRSSRPPIPEESHHGDGVVGGRRGCSPRWCLRRCRWEDPTAHYSTPTSLRRLSMACRRSRTRPPISRHGSGKDRTPGREHPQAQRRTR